MSDSDLRIALKNLRKDLRLTMHEAADCLHVSDNTVKKWEQYGIPAEQVLNITAILGFDNPNWVEQVNRMYGINIRYYMPRTYDEYEVDAVIYPELVTKDPFAPENLIVLIIQWAKDGFYTKNNEKRRSYIRSFIEQNRTSESLIGDNQIITEYGLLTAFSDIAANQSYSSYPDDSVYYSLILDHIKSIKDDDKRDMFTEKVFMSWMTNSTIQPEMLFDMSDFISDYVKNNISCSPNPDYRRMGLYDQLLLRIMYVLKTREYSLRDREAFINKAAFKVL